MLKSRFFFSQFILGFIGVFILLNNYSSLILNGIYLTLICFNFYLNRGKLFSIISFYTILFLTALIPILLVNLNIITDVVVPNSTRIFVLQEHYYSLAMDILIFSTFIMSSYLNLSIGFKASLIKGKNKFKAIYYEISILFFSYIINKDSSNILYDSYKGDGYVDGENFGGWAIFFIIFFSYYIYMTNLESKRNLYFSYFIIFYWFLFGNRGEIFPIVFFVLFISYSKKKKLKLFNFTRYLYALFLISIFFLIGIFRSGNFSYSGNLLLTLLSNFTGGPISYSFMSILYQTEKYGFSNGATFLDYLYRTLPSFITPNRPGDVSMFLVEEYSTGGGNLLIGEPYLNFGILGVFVFLHLFLSFFVWIEKMANKFNEYNYIFILIIFLGTRTVLYGFITFYKLTILFIIIIFFRILFNKGIFNLTRT